MLQKNFFEKIESHFKLELPFVAYRMPNKTSVKAMLQEDLKVHIVSDFTEIGFVFAPFNSEKQALLFPLKSCNTISSDISFLNDNSVSSHTTLISDIESHKHIALVQKGIDEIIKGQLQKVVLSRIKSVPISEDNPIAIFESLLKYYASAFVYVWYHPKIGLWLGATPETLMKVEGQRFQTVSLAGTQKYVDSKAVEWNAKNLEEQEIVTDFIESRIKPFAERINISSPQTVRAGQLLHLKSNISGVLKSNTLKQVIAVLHPTPAVCGIPKTVARDFIFKNEHYDREFYTGYLGELNVKESQSRNANKRNVENNAYGSIKTTSHLFVNLRCMKIEKQMALIYVGGGITKDSNAPEEWEETVNKTQTMLRVLDYQI